MKILVTGGAGFIGSHLVKRLLEKDNDVIVIDNFNDYYDPQIKRKNISQFSENPKFKLEEKDIRDDLNGVFKGNDISVVIHLAARAGVRPSLVDPELYNSVNVIGTVNLLESCRKYNIKKFIFGSSSSVYGTNSKLPFSEEDPLLNPISPYAVTKIAGENLCRVYSNTYGISSVCLRYFTVYGPGQRPEMAIHKFTRMINNGEPIPFYGDGSSSRDYTYITDIINGIIAALNIGDGFGIFNLGDSKTIKLNELVGLIEDGLGKKAKLNKMAIQPGDVPITYADISQAQDVLGYEPEVTIKDGVINFIKWYKKNF